MKAIMKTKTIKCMKPFMLLLMMLTSMTAWAMEGDGSSTNPYVIKNYSDLLEFRARVHGSIYINGVYLQPQPSACAIVDADFADDDYYYEWGGLSGHLSWIPICNDNHPYTGTFDGQNHVIRNLMNTKVDSSNKPAYAGLFGYIGQGGVVKNVTLDGCLIDGSQYTGLIAGYNEGTVSNVKVRSSEVFSYNSDYTGGVVGYNKGNVTAVTVTNHSVSGSKYTGGIAGYNEGYVGVATITDLKIKGGECVGGVVGRNDQGVVKNNNVTGTVTGFDGSVNQMVGGIVGLNNGGTVETCETSATITASTSGTEQYVGGIVGCNKSFQQIQGNINYCLCNTTITAHTTGSEQYVGGVVGSNENSITQHCLVMSTAITAHANGDVGAIAGYNNQSGQIQQCYFYHGGTTLTKVLGSGYKTNVSDTGAAYAIRSAVDITMTPTTGTITPEFGSGLKSCDIGLFYNNILYVTADANISFTLSTKTTKMTDYCHYVVSAGILSGTGPYTLTLPTPAVDIFIKKDYAGTFGDSFTWKLTELDETSDEDGKKPAYDLTVQGTGALTESPWDNTDIGIQKGFIVSVALSEGITSIANGAFGLYINMRSISVPSSVTSIGNMAFDRCRKLRSISLPSGLTTLGYAVFNECKSLKSVIIPDGVDKVNHRLFLGCDSLRSVTLGKGVKTIDVKAFDDCTQLMTLRLSRYEPNDANPITTIINGTVASNPFLNCMSFGSVVVPEAGKEAYVNSMCWGNYIFMETVDGNNKKKTIYFHDLLRTDHPTLFSKGATNEWASWVDKFNLAAPRGAEVYTIGGVENGVVKLQKVTATVTLPENEREGVGDDGVRALIQAFVPVVVRRQAGEVTRDLKMAYVNGGELIVENGWYANSTPCGSMWQDYGAYYAYPPDNKYYPRDIPDPMADVPYAYNLVSYRIDPAQHNPSGLKDHVYADFDGGWVYGNADKTIRDYTEVVMTCDNAFLLINDKFQRIKQSTGLEPHGCALILQKDGGDMTLETNGGTSLALADQSDNSDAIAAAQGTTVNVRLDGRNLYNEGSWNTLCLPFSMDATQIADSPLSGATIKTLDASASSFTGSALSLTFTDATTIEAGQPFIVKWNKPEADLIINNADEWNTFATTVNSGTESYAGKVVRLGQDVEGITTMVGTEENPFCGEFDGDGHTLTVNLVSNEENCGPFRFVNGAQISYLHIAGTLTTDHRHAGGFIACILDGNVTIDNCESSVNIINNHVESDPWDFGNYHGGFIGDFNRGITKITNCLFNGKFTQGTGNTLCNSGFVARGEPGITLLALTNCLFAPSGTLATTEDPNDLYSRVNETFARSASDELYMTHCYHTEIYGSKVDAGADIPDTNEELLAILGSRWEMRDGKVKPILHSIISNPVFKAVTVSGIAPAEVCIPSGGKFVGSYSPFGDASDVLSDANNTGNGAFHAVLTNPSPADNFLGWYKDAAFTTPTTTIPFGADGSVTFYARWANYVLKLADTSDNSAAIAAVVASGQSDNGVVTLCGRTLYKDGDWNTLCLPFSLSKAQIVNSPLAGATIMALNTASSNLTDGTLTLNFTAATDIEAGKPYIIKWQKPEADLVINNAGEWDTFAANVTNGNTYEGKLVQLGDNITITTMVGKSGNQGYPFKGTFDGQGHTITANLVGGADDEGTAPFYSINDATIKNLKVTGTITTQKHRPASFAAIAGGVSTIKNCWSSADLLSTRQNDWVDAGAIVACIEEGKTLNITDCAFTGTVTYDASAREGGGVVGWARSGATANITRCLYAPSSVTISSNAEPSRIFVNGYTQGNLTNCYYNAVAAATTALSLDKASQGTDASGMSNDALLTALGQQWQIVGTQVLPVISGALEYSNIVDPTFSGVTISNATTNNEQAFSGGKFVGSFSPVSFTANDKSILFLGAENKLYWPNADMTLGACRAHFELSDGSGAREIKLNFEGGESTSIHNAQCTMHNEAGAWYDMQGRKFSQKPTKKGLYIYKGRKVVIQ